MPRPTLLAALLAPALACSAGAEAAERCTVADPSGTPLNVRPSRRGA